MVTFHPGLPSVTKTVKKHWNVMVNQSNRLKRCFEMPSMVAYKRPQNLRDILIRAKTNIPAQIRSSNRSHNGFTHCGRMCYACIQCDRATHHKCNRTGTIWEISNPINCLTTNVIYKLSCRKCGWFVYIGETERRFCDRLTDHRGYVTRKVNNAIGEHFNLPGHDLTDMIPLPIEKVFPEGNLPIHTQIRKRREKYWIRMYDAVSFDGANTKE